MSPLTILEKSWNIILGVFPERAWIRSVQIQDALMAWLGVQIASHAILALSGMPVTPQSIVFNAVIAVVYLGLVVGIGTFILNRYAAEKFTYQEILALDVVLTAASSLIFAIVSFAQFKVGLMGASILGLASFAFMIFMLFRMQTGISLVANITKGQAALVIILPMIPIML
ncbi:MAG: hypothetical protein RI911_662, partial [Candidatus Parcubacteria bacterium]